MMQGNMLIEDHIQNIAEIRGVISALCVLSIGDSDGARELQLKTCAMLDAVVEYIEFQDAEIKREQRTVGRMADEVARANKRIRELEGAEG